MRSFVLRSRTSALSCSVSFVVLSGLLAGCSSDFARFDRANYPSAKTGKTTQLNPYPGNIDTTTTASTRRRILPVADMKSAAVSNTPQAVYHNPEPIYAATAPQNIRPSYQAPNPTYQQAYNQNIPAPSYETTASIQRQPLAMAISPKPVNENYSRLNPGRIAPVSDVQALANTPTTGGWNNNNGSTYTVKQGETLYNLSKRFGVPVAAILAANGLKNADSVQAGQRIKIPNYNYSKTAPVSAPDHHPMTKASRASTG